MKTRTLYVAVALGLLICGCFKSIAQQLSTSAPIIIQLSEIDRYGVMVWPPSKTTAAGRLGLPFHDMKQSEVDTLVRDGTTLNREVWVMDGQRVIAKCSLIGDFIYHHDDSKPETEYGLFLGFDSAEEAQKVGAQLKLEPSLDEPSLDELICSRKSQLSDQRFWILF